MIKFLLISGTTLLIQLNMLQIASALKCYECTSDNGVSCYDPINKLNIKAVDCQNSAFIKYVESDDKFQCVIYQDLYRNNHTYIERKCALVTTADFCLEHKNDAINDGFAVTQCLACQTDYCNTAANHLHIPFLFVLLMHVLVIFDY